MTANLVARNPAVAGLFYPDDPSLLREQVQNLLEAEPSTAHLGHHLYENLTTAHLATDRLATDRLATENVSAVRPSTNDLAAEHRSSKHPGPKALIVPHAGYPYSGPIAATAYRTLAPIAGSLRRVVLLGPSHRVPFAGIATCSADVYRTPLGDVPLDRAAAMRLQHFPEVIALDRAHVPEHSLEVQLPFLQLILSDFQLLPLVVGQASETAVAQVLEQVWGGPETLIVLSSDLSHYLDDAQARALDQETCRAIENLNTGPLDGAHACGWQPLSGLLVAARRHGLTVTTLDLRNSGDTAGTRDSVVGYGAWALH